MPTICHDVMNQVATYGFEYRVVHIPGLRERGDRKYEIRYSYSGTYAVSAALRPGIEAYARPADRAYQAGPIVAGEWHIPGTTSNLEYRFGVVLGLNAAAPRRTWLTQVEYEFF